MIKYQDLKVLVAVVGYLYVHVCVYYTCIKSIFMVMLLKFYQVSSIKLFANILITFIKIKCWLFNEPCEKEISPVLTKMPHNSLSERKRQK